MAGHQEKDERGDTVPQPTAEPVTQQHIDAIARETQEAVADADTLRHAIENLAAAVPDVEFAKRYEELMAGMYYPSEAGMSDAIRGMVQQREYFNAALVRLFEAVLALRRDLSEEELRSIGTLFRSANGLWLLHFLTPEAMERVRVLVPQLFAERRFFFLGTVIRYEMMRGGRFTLSEIVARTLAASAKAGRIPPAHVLDFFERTLIDTANEDDDHFCVSRGLECSAEYLQQNNGDPALAVEAIFRSMQHEAREMVEKEDDFVSIFEERFRKLLEDKRCSGKAQIAIFQLLDKNGVGVREYLDWWADGMGWVPYRTRVWEELAEEQKASCMEHCMRNVRRCLQLEAHHRDCLYELLSTFNIHDVGRYEFVTLREQFEERENIHNPYVLVVFPRDDHNGAFYCIAHALEALRKQLAERGYLLRIIEGGERDIFHTLAHLHKKKGYTLPSGIVLGAHGLPHQMFFSKQHPFSLKITARRKGKGWEVWKGMEEGMENLFRKKAKQCPMVLISCSTGKSVGMAHIISRYTEGVVSGPQIPTNVAAIRAQFDENGKLTALVPIFQEGKTGTFHAGSKVPVAEEEILEAIPVEGELPPEEER